MGVLFSTSEFPNSPLMTTDPSPSTLLSRQYIDTNDTESTETLPSPSGTVSRHGLHPFGAERPSLRGESVPSARTFPLSRHPKPFLSLDKTTTVGRPVGGIDPVRRVGVGEGLARSTPPSFPSTAISLRSPLVCGPRTELEVWDDEKGGIR